MLTIKASSLRTTPSAAAPASGTGGSQPASSADPAGFASLLRQTQVPPAPMRTPPAPAPAPVSHGSSGSETKTEPAPSQEAANEPPAPQESETTGRTRALQKSKLRAADGTTATPRDAKPGPDSGDAKTPAPLDKTGTADSKATETQPPASASPTDPNVMQWLAGMQRAATEQVVDARTGAHGKLAATELDPKDTLAPGDATSAAALGASAFVAAAAAGEHEDIVEKPRYTAPDSTGNVTAAGAGALAPAPAAGTASAPVAVAIAAPVTTPDFAQELGLRLTTLAKDGVQTAELHLNPADMGPVSVQIVMDGTQARVDFGADVAATRQAIEAGLPELASALADAGFTLAGGGVSQHAGGRSGSGSGSGNDPGSSNGGARRIATDKQVTRVASAARRIATKGGIDLFA